MPYGTVLADNITDSYGGKVSPISVPFRNRIINGAMMIDQRNNGASVTTTTTGSFTYSLDRWNYLVNNASKFTIQQNAGSVTTPVGFVNYLGVTSTATTSVGSGDYYAIGQFIEGYNVADLGWGTANAKTVTLSFQVYSSLTGTFSGAIQNSAQNRSYPFTFTVSSANTWTTISVTIAGDTTGTWLTTNGIGMRVFFSMGMGSTLSGTAGSWAGSAYYSATGATSVVGTNGATFYITGVQLEKGSTATSFDYRPYGTELSLCQRYYQIWALGQYGRFAVAYNDSPTTCQTSYYLPVALRAQPTVTYTAITSSGTSITPGSIALTNNLVWIGNNGSGLTVGATQIYGTSPTSNNIQFSSEL